MKTPPELLKDNCQKLDGANIKFGFTDDNRSVEITNKDGTQVTKADSVRLLVMLAHTVAVIMPDVKQFMVIAEALADQAMQMEYALAGRKPSPIILPAGGA